VNSVVALYFNFFVLIAQSFQKIPVLKALAPTQSEPPFAIAQLVALVAFVVLGTLAVKKFRGVGHQTRHSLKVVPAIS
jgi:flagellar biogenesis protein FliO